MSHSPRSLLGKLCDVPNPTSDDVMEVGFRANDYFGSVFQELIAFLRLLALESSRSFREHVGVGAGGEEAFARQVDSLRDI